MISIVACSQSDTAAPSSQTGIAVAPTGGPSFFTTADPGAQSLGTYVLGPNKVVAPGNVTYRGVVSGGTGPYRYDWFQEYCYDVNDCNGPYLMRSGVGVDTIQLYYPPEMYEMTFTLHVYDSQTYAHVGTGSIYTPNLSGDEYVSGQSGLSCDLGEHYFPVRDWDLFPGTDTARTRYYRRNGCTGGREYSPTGGPNGW